MAGYGHAGTVYSRALRAAAILALAALCAASFMGARRMFMGVPLGSVLDVDARTGAVSADLGAADGVLKGIMFSVVDEKGRQAALITPAEIYDGLFWSRPLPAGEAGDVRPGMEVRWIFTPELSMLVQARRKNSPEAYRNFARTYPESVLLSQLVRTLPESMIQEIDPAFFEAWKLYTSQGFEAYLAGNPRGAFAAAAKAELKSINDYDAQQERRRLERQKQADAYQEELRRQEEIREKAMTRRQQMESESMHGKLVNNSPDPVRFVFEPPAVMQPTVVNPSEEFEVSHPAGTFSYKVFPVEADGPGGLLPDEADEPGPLAEGTVEIVFDFWELQYP